MTIMKRKTTYLLLSLLISVSAWAVPAKSGIYTFKQPNGSSFQVNLKGDEFYKMTTTLDGCAIILDDDGWYSYAYYDNSGKKFSTGVHVGEELNSEIYTKSHNIPTHILQRNAAEMRALRGRLNSERNVKPLMTKASKEVKTAIVILAQFSDLKFTYTRNDFVNMLTKEGYSANGATGCALDYFKAQIGDVYDFNFVVSDIVTLKNGYAYYGKNGNDGSIDKKAAEGVAEACKLADPKIDFTQFDLDNDGEIDNVFVFVPGHGENEGASSDHIWPHQWYVSDGAGITVRVDGKLVNSYAISTEMKYGSGGKDVFTPIGTFCHEYGHAIGLYDHYDTDYEESGGQSKACWGSTDVMDSGCYNNDGNTPPYYNALELEMLGVGTQEYLEIGEFSLEPIGKSKRALRVETDVDGEYYLFECRDNSGWDQYIGGSGMLIYHVDKSNNAAGYSDTYAFNMRAIDRWYYNEVNCNPDHQCMDLIECIAKTASVSQVFWPSGTHTTFSSTTEPSFSYWDGSGPDFGIANIKKVDGNITFMVTGPLSINNIEVFQDAAIVQWSMSAGGKNANSYISISGPTGNKTYEVKPYDNGLYAYTFEGLKDKSSYSIKVSTKKDGGESVTDEFTTKAYYNDGYPFIYLNSAQRDSQGYFKKGTQMPLRIYNARNVEHVSWQFNTTAAEDDGSGYWTVEQDGTLKAYVYYSDGTIDIITKRIQVK